MGLMPMCRAATTVFRSYEPTATRAANGTAAPPLTCTVHAARHMFMCTHDLRPKNVVHHI